MHDERLRTVTDEQKIILKEALSEVQRSVSHGTGNSAFGATHEFSQELVIDVVGKCHKLFNMEDIKTNVPVFSKNHALAILEIINEVCNDIMSVL